MAAPLPGGGRRSTRGSRSRRLRARAAEALEPRMVVGRDRPACQLAGEPRGLLGEAGVGVSLRRPRGPRPRRRGRCRRPRPSSGPRVSARVAGLPAGEGATAAVSAAGHRAAGPGRGGRQRRRWTRAAATRRARPSPRSARRAGCSEGTRDRPGRPWRTGRYSRSCPGVGRAVRPSTWLRPPAAGSCPSVNATVAGRAVLSADLDRDAFAGLRRDPLTRCARWRTRRPAQRHRARVERGERRAAAHPAARVDERVPLVPRARRARLLDRPGVR